MEFHHRYLPAPSLLHSGLDFSLNMSLLTSPVKALLKVLLPRNKDLCAVASARCPRFVRFSLIKQRCTVSHWCVDITTCARCVFARVGSCVLHLLDDLLQLPVLPLQLPGLLLIVVVGGGARLQRVLLLRLPLAAGDEAPHLARRQKT